jgi:micrococcal nuclease
VRRALLLTLLTAGCAAAAPATEPAATALPVPAGAQDAVVVRHVDGDTFWLRGIGTGPVPAGRTKIRLLEVDTPEVSGQVECYGREAARRTAELIPVGSHVRVEADRERRDRYGRVLVYVWTAEGASLEEQLLAGGYARVLYVRPNDRHLDLLRRVEASARERRAGLWGACAAS